MNIKKKFKKIAALFTSLLFASISCIASAATEEGILTIKNYLEKRSPPINAKSITPTPIPEIYEVYTGSTIFYMDKTASYALVGGSLLDDTAKKNLTDDRLKELSRIKFAELPFQHSIAIKKGTGVYKFAVFSDPDCSYCKSLEQDLDKNEINDYTAYVFLYPLKHLHPEAAIKSESIWCAKDKAEAWLDWMIKGIAPTKTSCENPVASNIELAQDIGVNGTPSIYSEDGYPIKNLKELVDRIKVTKIEK